MGESSRRSETRGTGLRGSDQRKDKMEGINEETEMRDWEEYFRNLLDGVERRMFMREKRKEGEEEGEEDISREEVRSVIEKLKKWKAMGIDGVSNEVWKYFSWYVSWVLRTIGEQWTRYKK